MSDGITTQDPDGRTWCTGYQDGYNVGPDGVTPDGQRAGYNEELIGDPEYRRAASTGRSDRIDEQLRTLPGGGA
jgi:hypothetical protein